VIASCSTAEKNRDDDCRGEQRAEIAENQRIMPAAMSTAGGFARPSVVGLESLWKTGECPVVV
jgi:hypothetical protein